jgi:hypothetical protein
MEELRTRSISGVAGRARASTPQPPRPFLFVSRIRRELAGLRDNQRRRAIVFTAGIGEHSWKVREAALKDMEWMGVHFDMQANQRQCSNYQLKNSPTSVFVIPTNGSSSPSTPSLGRASANRRLQNRARLLPGPSAARAARALAAAMSDRSAAPGARTRPRSATGWKTSPVRRNFAPIPCPVSISRDGTMTVC